MTIAQTPSALVSINQLILLALKRAGVVPIEARLSGANMVSKLEHGRATLNLIMDALATEGFIARTTGFHDLAMVAGEPYYTLPEDVLDVHGDAMFVPSHNPDTKFTTGELVCKQIDLFKWSTLTVKGSISTRPQLYCVFRHGALVNLRFWPVPSELGVMRLAVTRLFGSSSDGTKSADVERFWYDCLVWQLAYYIAVDTSMPADRVAMLQGIAESKKRQCVNFSFEHTTGPQAVVDYTTQWSA
jgi:hypothetical protein